MYINYKIVMNKDMVVLISIKEGDSLEDTIKNDVRFKDKYNTETGIWFLDITRL